METIFELVIPHITDPQTLSSISLVSTHWYQTDRITRKHVTIALCYSITPKRLSCRFPHLESLKIKEKPRASMFNLIPEDWGGYAGPWVDEIVKSLNGLKSLHLRRMIVSDEDLEKIGRRLGKLGGFIRIYTDPVWRETGRELYYSRSISNLGMSIRIDGLS